MFSRFFFPSCSRKSGKHRDVAKVENISATHFSRPTIQLGRSIFAVYLERQDLGREMRPRVKNRKAGVDSLQVYEKFLSRFTSSGTWIKYCF